ncbi:MAG: hydroxymethylbilane synthase [Alphaproteobacteria bacterium]|nr:hydroxymethylbilane synthase [Alphaproteobacteria bacterium]
MKHIRIGTRRSKLARIQAELVASKLHAWGVETTIIPIQTSGDQNQNAPLADIGGKALFCKELQLALLDDHIDIAVHSLKDLEVFHPQGLKLLTTIERDDPGDIFLTHKGNGELFLKDSPFVLGTCSPRRACFMKHLYPNVRIVPLRGNVETRLDKLSSGIIDATILAASGLNRLGILGQLTQQFDVIPLNKQHFTPACGQGIIAIEGKDYLYDFMQRIGHAPTYAQAILERYVQQVFEGTCHSALGAYATILGQKFNLQIQYEHPIHKDMHILHLNGDLKYYKTIIQDALGPIRI